MAKNSFPYIDKWQALIDEVRMDYKYTCAHTGLSVPSAKVLDAIAKVPRHKFVPPSLVQKAYDNRPLPIGLNQTISQPYIVALMTDLLDIRDDARVLEIGTGSGYQAAILAELARTVYSTEIISELADNSSEVLHELGYDNIVTCRRDGYDGWSEYAPFDGIIVTAAAPDIPPALIEQLAAGAKLIIPVGEYYGGQKLLSVIKKKDGSIKITKVLDVAFVPLTRAIKSN